MILAGSTLCQIARAAPMLYFLHHMLLYTIASRSTFSACALRCMSIPLLMWRVTDITRISTQMDRPTWSMPAKNSSHLIVSTILSISDSTRTVPHPIVKKSESAIAVMLRKSFWRKKCRFTPTEELANVTIVLWLDPQKKWTNTPREKQFCILYIVSELTPKMLPLHCANVFNRSERSICVHNRDRNHIVQLCSWWVKK